MKKSKILFIVTLTLLFCVAFSVNSLAYSEEESVYTERDETESSADLNEGAESKNGFFENLLSACESNASEIFSALAFIGSLIMMLCYKKGLLPIVNDGLKALKNGVKSIGEKSDTFTNQAVGLCESIDARLERAEKLSEAVLKSAESVEEDILEIQKSGRENEKLKIILLTQIDMLYEIFMSAALPQYLKENVGEKIVEMKAALGKEEE